MLKSRNINSSRPSIVKAWRLLWLILVLTTSLATPSAGQERYDVIIRNARVLDGSRNPWFRADVAIRGDRIAVVGRLSDAAAEREFDASGLYLTPGFIDSHSHAAGGLISREGSAAQQWLTQGVTTAIINPDGGGPIDLAEQREALLNHGLGINVAQLVPHGSVRGEVIGTANRLASGEELERMRSLVRRGMEQGAFGLSSGPFYVPGSYSDTPELVELAKVAAAYGGVYTSHIRDESNYTIGLVAAVDEVIEVARRAGLPGVVTHIKALGPPVWGYSLAVVQRIEKAREEGLEVYADQYPYLASSTSLAAALLPRWAQAGGRDSLLARFGNPKTLAKIREAMIGNLARRGGADRIQLRRFSADPSVQGRSLASVADERRKSPIEAAVAILRKGSPGIISFNMNDRDVRTLMVQPWMMTSSDGGSRGFPHPRSFGAFPRKIRKYVLDEKVVDLPAAIRSMTSLPAQVFRLQDRGAVRAGAYADLVVFDLERVLDRATFPDPAQFAEGMVHVFVNGQAAILTGKITAVNAGQVLRRQVSK
jgi:N-acyl-D-aspartate/D-glutamate deacylase